MMPSMKALIPLSRSRHPGKNLRPASAVHPPEEEQYAEAFEEQLPVILAAQKGESWALGKLDVLSHPLRRSKAQRFLPGRPDLHEDAIQAAWLGVLKALRKWNGTRNRLFLAYAHWDISEAVRDFKYEMELTVPRPAHLHRKLSRLTKFHTSDVGELSQLSGLSSESIQGIMALKHGDLSFQRLCPDQDEEMGLPFLQELETDETPSRALHRAELLHLLEEGMTFLSDRELHIVNLYYREESTFGQIAATLHLTRQRVEQINAAALQKLRRYFLQRDPHLPVVVKPRSSKASSPSLPKFSSPSARRLMPLAA